MSKSEFASADPFEVGRSKPRGADLSVPQGRVIGPDAEACQMNFTELRRHSDDYSQAPLPRRDSAEIVTIGQGPRLNP